MAKADLKVVGVVCRGHLNSARAEADLAVFVAHDGNFAVHNGQDAGLADEVLEKLDVVNASIHAPCYKDGDATDHTSAYLAIVNNPLVDVICHSGSPAFAYDYEKIIDLAKKNHKLIEINNHSFDVRKASIPNCRKIAEICKEKEVGIVVSSDAHITFDLGNYNNALGMLSEISFTEKLVINRDLKSFEAYMKEKGKELFKWHM